VSSYDPLVLGTGQVQFCNIAGHHTINVDTATATTISVQYVSLPVNLPLKIYCCYFVCTAYAWSVSDS